MKRVAVCILLLTISVWAGAQASQPANNSGSGNSAPQTYVVPATVAWPGGLSTNTGTAVIYAPPSTPLLVTPEVHLSTVNPATGASNATPGNAAGAANSTMNMAVPPRIITTVPQFSTLGASSTQTLPPQEGAVAANTGVGTSGVGSPVMIVNNAMLFDRGVGSNGPVVGGGTDGRSLGEIARDNRQHEAGANAHLYTNDDINRINTQPPTTVGGMSGAAVGAGNPPQPQPATGNAPAVAQPSTTQPSTNPPANPGVSQPVPPASNTPPPEQSQTEQKQLPGGGSILPLMAVMGVLATGAGLLAK